MSSDVLQTLARELRASGGPLAEAVCDPSKHATAALGEMASAGPRAAGDPGSYALLVETIREGYELHYGTPRVLDDADPDLALLAGDHLFALGLARLAALGDLDAVRELADVISLSAVAHAGGEPQRAQDGWVAGARAVGHGR